MSQLVKLKRTAVEGKVPNTSNIELGELAINTYDGRIFFEKDNGTPTIQQVVTTNSQTTGSLNILGNVTASFFIGNGSQLTNLPAVDVSQVVTVTASFQETSSISVNHNFASRNVIVSVYDSSYSQLIPTSVVLTDNNNVDITLSGPNSGFAVVAKGGHIVSGTLVQEVSEVFTVTASFDNQSTIAVTHNFESKNVIVSVYDSNDSQLIPQSVTLTNLNTATIVLSANHSGFVVVAKGGHLVSGSAITSYSNLTNKPSGLVSGSSQLTSSYDIRYALSGSVGGGSTDISSLNSFTSSIQTRVDGLSSQTASLATTGSNTFTGTQTLSGSIIPAIDNTYDLGSVTYQWRDIYVSSGSLYIDGTKVLGSTGNELQITTDVGQSIKILEAGSDSIILQSADGDIQLKTSGGGNLLFDPTSGLIDVRGTLQIQDGNKITSSGGNTIQFGNDLGITGSLTTTTGNINGINLTTFSSSVATQISTIQNKTGSFATTGSNTFVGTQNINGNIYLTGSIIPSGSFVYDLGSEANSFRDIFLSTGSIRFHNPDGTEQGRITVDAKSGDISLLKTAGLTNEQKATISQGNINPDFLTAISASSLFIQTKIVTAAGATINGINLTAFSSSVSSTIINQNTATSSYETKGRGIISGSSQLNNASIENLTVINLTTVNETASVIFSSGSNRFGDFGNDTHSFTGSVQISGSIVTIGSSTATSYNGTINSTNGVVSGSSQITYANISSIPGGIVSGSSQTIANLPTGTVSGSSQVVGILSSLNTYTGSNDTTNTAQNSRLTSIESATGSYETKGRSIVSGSSQITISSTTGYGSVINQALLTTSAPAFAGATFSNKVESTNPTSNTVNLTVPTGYNYNGYQSYWGTRTGTAFDFNLDVYNSGTQINALKIAQTGTATFSGNVLPAANGTQDLGSSAARWSTVYTSDLSLNNGIGDWTIVEGEDDLFLYNNKKGKVYKFALTEVDPNVATPKKS